MEAQAASAPYIRAALARPDGLAELFPPAACSLSHRLCRRTADRAHGGKRRCCRTAAVPHRRMIDALVAALCCGSSLCRCSGARSARRRDARACGRGVSGPVQAQRSSAISAAQHGAGENEPCDSGRRRSRASPHPAPTPMPRCCDAAGGPRCGSQHSAGHWYAGQEARAWASKGSGDRPASSRSPRERQRAAR